MYPYSKNGCPQRQLHCLFPAESEQICDLLTYIGSPIRSMEIMGTKAIKQVRNNGEPQTNGEVANIGKIATASAKQLSAIEHKKTVGIDSLRGLAKIAYLRLEIPICHFVIWDRIFQPQSAEAVQITVCKDCLNMQVQR